GASINETILKSGTSGGFAPPRVLRLESGRRGRRRMSQAEIAGGTLNPPNEFPSPGHLFRDFALKSTRGHDVQLSDYRSRVSLIVIFTDEKSGTATWLLDLASQY